jgi:crotonobetainyl-CoA:carnitine CoA-transferase CaiB-like acyl-CoA transferase
MVREVEHAVGGPLRILANPIRLSATPIEDYAAPPTVGQDTDAVLGALGYDADARQSLRAQGAI